MEETYSQHLHLLEQDFFLMLPHQFQDFQVIKQLQLLMQEQPSKLLSYLEKELLFQRNISQCCLLSKNSFHRHK